jgi:light-regulated signal transduction histidine kinase (bacteriophytochrome)
LLQNALRFHPKDPEHVIQIKVIFESEGSSQMITIEDNGIGVSETQREEMLRPFKRLNNVEDYPGLGMGLTYCRYITEIHGAALAFKESNGGGLTAIYTYPIRKSNASKDL